MVYRRKGKPEYYLAVPTRHGWLKRSAGTTDKATARAMERMLGALGPRGARAGDLLDSVADRTLALGDLYDAWRSNDLDGLRARRTDVDLAGHVDGWAAWLADRVKPVTVESYLAHVRALIPVGEPFARSQFTAPAVAQWLATRSGLSGSTKRHYLAGLQRFAAYLVDMGVLASNPLRDVSAPPPNPPRCAFLELPDVRRVVEGAPLPFRAIYALAYGAGLEISAILALVDADVNAPAREVRARGTKAWTRDRLARVADWAWPHVQAHLDTLLPGERLFRGINRRAAGEVHRERLKALGLPHHRLHDSRHHWAVRMVRAGMPLELVARQLGHRDVVMVAKVYGRFVPTSQERDRWEGIAPALDAEKWAGRGVSGGASEVKAHEPNGPNADANESTGGRRLLDAPIRG
jgi:integrase